MQAARKIGRTMLKSGSVSTELMVLTHRIVEGWERPPFQRPAASAKKVSKLAVKIQDRGYLLTAIYLGVLDGVTYLVDGQNRREAFIASGLVSIKAPVLTKHYPDGKPGLLEMCEDFLLINEHIQNPSANDKLRALEPTNVCISKIHSKCPFVGYTNLRRKEDSPIVSMAQVIRALITSGKEVPSSPGKSAVAHAMETKIHEADGLSTFLNVAFKAWGRDKEYKLFWKHMNMSLCLWYFRRMLRGPSIKSQGTVTLEQFHNIFLALLANNRYHAILKKHSGGRMNDPETRDPVCKELRGTIKASLKRDGVKDYYLPKLEWPES